MRITAAVTALMLLAAPAVAGEYLLPPKEYDKPYTGDLRITIAKSQAEVRAFCPNVAFNLGVAMACTKRIEGVCWMMVVSDAELTAHGFPPDMVRRHEIAHCNGWGGDHKGARLFEEWAEAPAPKKPPPLTPWPPVYRNCGIAIQKPCD